MITAIFCLVIGMVSFWYGFQFIKLYLKVKKWTKTEADLVSKKIEIHKKYSTSKSPYAVRIEYKYTYNFQEFFNNKVYLIELINGQVNHIETQAQKVIDKVNDKIEIYVNPKNPQQSVIFCNRIILYLIVIVMGSFSFLFGLTSLINKL